VFAYHLRIQEAVTANAAMPLVAGEDVRTPLRAFRVVFGIGHLKISRGPVLTNPTIYAASGHAATPPSTWRRLKSIARVNRKRNAPDKAPERL
jgi:hypothetical protein